MLVIIMMLVIKLKKVELWESRDKLSDKVSLVDDEDYEIVMKAITARSKWYAHKPGKAASYYAFNGRRDKSIHRVIMDPPEGMVVDHINGNCLDNRRENLRICSYSQNSCNKKVRTDSKSGFKGVCQRGKRYQAYIGDPGTPALKKRNIKLGTYNTAIEAAAAYDKKAVEFYGEYAKINFPENIKQYMKEKEL